MNQLCFLIGGILMGTLYYMLMKYTIKDPYKNCSFVSSRLTDILAFIVGGIILYYGICVYKNNVLVTVGIAIITEHILQFSYKPL